MEMPLTLNRFNQLERRGEYWQPPPFRPIKGRRDRVLAAARRFFDVQASSIWRDLSRLVPRCRGRLLDVGCGAQPYRSLVHVDAAYLGIDRGDLQTDFGYCPSETMETLWYQGDRWPITDASVDLVLSIETLEHVPDPSVFLSEAFRCLKPGGSLLLTVPFAARWHFIPQDYWRFTPSGLERLLCAAGFADIAVYARGNALTVACYKVMALLLPLLLPQHGSLWKRLTVRCVGLLALPVVILLAAIANLSLHGQGGGDCLGYTVVSVRRTTWRKSI